MSLPADPLQEPRRKLAEIRHRDLASLTEADLTFLLTHATAGIDVLHHRYAQVRAEEKCLELAATIEQLREAAKAAKNT